VSSYFPSQFNSSFDFESLPSQANNHVLSETFVLIIYVIVLIQSLCWCSLGSFKFFYYTNYQFNSTEARTQ